MQKQHKHCANPKQQRTYAELKKSDTNLVENTAITLNKFLDEFKDLFDHLI